MVSIHTSESAKYLLTVTIISTILTYGIHTSESPKYTTHTFFFIRFFLHVWVLLHWSLDPRTRIQICTYFTLILYMHMFLYDSYLYLYLLQTVQWESQTNSPCSIVSHLESQTNSPCSITSQTNSPCYITSQTNSPCSTVSHLESQTNSPCSTISHHRQTHLALRSHITDKLTFLYRITSWIWLPRPPFWDFRERRKLDNGWKLIPCCKDNQTLWT